MPALTIYNIKLKKDKILKIKLSLAPCENCIQLSNISRWAERTLCECIDSSHYQFTSQSPLVRVHSLIIRKCFPVFSTTLIFVFDF